MATFKPNIKSDINITISGYAKTGKTGLAFKIGKFLEQNGLRINIDDYCGREKPDERPYDVLSTLDKRFERAKKTSINIVVHNVRRT